MQSLWLEKQTLSLCDIPAQINPARGSPASGAAAHLHQHSGCWDAAK